MKAFKFLLAICLSLVLLVRPTFCQQKKLSPAQMRADLDYLNKYLKKFHPTYYAYTSSAEMNAMYADLQSKCDSNTTGLQFQGYLKNAVSKVGCGHMGVFGPKSKKSLDTLLAVPFDVNLLGDRIFVRKYFGNDGKLKVGDEILSINGMKTIDFLTKIRDFKASDGFNLSHKDYSIEYVFFAFCYFAFEQPNVYSLTVSSSVDSIQKLQVEAVKRSTTFERYYRNTVDSSKILIKGAYINLQKTTINDQTFLIDFNSFSGAHLRKSYRQIFKYLHEHKAANLIIDLRDNGGGNVFGGFNFMKYLVKAPVQFLNFSRRPNFTVINPHLKAGFFERISPLLFMTNPIQYPSKHGWNHAFFFVKHFRHHFAGNLYVITNGQTFSMAAVTASILKNKEKAVIIGEETGGNSFANRGMAQGALVLPNSKNRVQLNLYQLKYGQGIDAGRGVMPDHPVTYTFEERNKKLDLEMMKITELILKQ